jgi:N-acetylglucosaminyldiphosphoundecaprenol N-acetyl-beta-D-mannosaminyltransferase
MLAVGAAFDYGAGTKKEPPMFLQRAGLQWAWRLAEEPGRLWKRYFGTNIAFLLRLPGELARPRRRQQFDQR